jgi:hypothetical protein
VQEQESSADRSAVAPVKIHPTVPGSIHIESGSYGLHSFRVSVHTLTTDRLQCVGYPNPGFISFLVCFSCLFLRACQGRV